MLHWRRDKTAFAISGGGARGAAQVGMLRALIERDITPDMIVGVSIGAWNGAWLAYRPDLEWVKQLEQVWRQVNRRTLDMVWWRAARNMVRRKPSLYEGGGLSRFIAQHLQVSTFEDLAVPSTRSPSTSRWAGRRSSPTARSDRPFWPRRRSRASSRRS